MTLQSSGAISANDIHNEFQSGNQMTTMWEHLGEALNTNTAPRGMPTGPISFSDFYGKTAYGFNSNTTSGAFITTTIGNGILYARVRDDLGTTIRYVNTSSSLNTMSLDSHASQVAPSGYNESWQARDLVAEWVYRTALTPANNMYSFASVPSGFGDTINLISGRTWISGSNFVGYNSGYDTSWPVGGGSQFIRGTFTSASANRLWQNSVKWKVQPEHINVSSSNLGITCGIVESDGNTTIQRTFRINLT